MKHEIIKKWSGALLIFIFVLGFFLRVYRVSDIPPALSWDEVSIGYNAYSILKTGRDEHGKFMPTVAFAAFGDYKPPLSIYLTVPAVFMFGLNEFAVRLPSVIAGTLTIPIVWAIVSQLLPGLPLVSVLAALILAISPWHIQLSRAGFEANIATFFVGLGVWFVLKARKLPTLWLVCWVPFVLAMYTFNSARYFAPLLGLGLLLYSWKDIRKNLKLFAIGIIFVFILAAPLVPYLFSKEARLRFAEVNIFSDSHVVTVANTRMAADENASWAGIFHNRRIGYAREYLVHFFDHLEPSFLFIRGDGNPKFSIQDVGQLYLIEAPLLLFGLFWLFRDHTSVGLLLVYWLFMAIVPAAVARETPHALRIENSLPTWQIFIAYGIYGLMQYFKGHWRKVIAIGMALLYVLSVSYYLHNYYRHYSKEFSGEWQYGYREAITLVQPLKDRYKSVVITDTIGRPYMYTLFYTRYDPQMFWKTVDGSFDAAGFYNVYGFDTYRFVRGAEVGELKKNTLYVLPPHGVPSGARILHTVKLLNGVPILVLFDLP